MEPGLLLAEKTRGRHGRPDQSRVESSLPRTLTHFLDGGWTEIVESRDEEESEGLFDSVESAHSKLSRTSRGKVA